ncbi:MAG: 5'-methylthioadenosine/adenosylhomocysteine nucleosidase [Chitinophagaceae bacterium]|nr:5'-methylthioadenosine/adenosylhomocysteine nucleosidase [Chitinophagaceae bacterium]
MQQKIVGIIGAMPEEINGVVSLLSDCTQTSMGMRTYYTGRINGIKTVVVFSRWGKVAAAATVATLIHEFNITELIFTGVAGAVNDQLHIGDIVIGKRMIQHDMDARPLMPQYEIPLLEKTFFDCDQTQSAIAVKATATLLQNSHLHQLISKEELLAFNIVSPRLFIGDIASGDQFFATSQQKKQLIKQLPATLCVEMEGAAVAQVCFENDIPFAVIRTISDVANEQSHIDFPSFIQKIAGKYSKAIIGNIFSNY